MCLRHEHFLRLAPARRRALGQGLAFVFTWLCYAIVTASRSAFAISKNAFAPDDGALGHGGPRGGWAPFNSREHGKANLGYLDACFMAGYTIGMPFMGAIADRFNSVYCLASSMVVTSFFLALFGLGNEWNVHSLLFYLTVAFLCGVAQSMAFPCVIPCMSNWFDKANIGKTIGLWSSCSPLGIVIGKLLCTVALSAGAGHWSPVFFAPALAMVTVAAVSVRFLIADPHQVQLARSGEEPLLQTEAHGAPTCAGSPPNIGKILPSKSADFGCDLLLAPEEPLPLDAILRIPNLIAYCLATMVAKGVFFAFLFWLPFYLSSCLKFSTSVAGNVSSLFDIGGFVGGLSGGFLSDKFKSRGLVCCVLQMAACPLMIAYQAAGLRFGFGCNLVLLFLVGLCVSAPYNLITSVAAVDLGTHPVLRGNGKAKATVTAIVDTCGSFGAAVSSPLVGALGQMGWQAVFFVLAVTSLCSGFIMVLPARAELRTCRQARERLEVRQ